MAEDKSMTWLQLRASRAKPPGRAGSSASRRQTYGAALQQFEELMNAAESVGPYSRPLPLLYALRQAGRAVAAAHAAEDWELRGHGSKATDLRQESIGRVNLVAQADGSFPRLCDITGTGRMSGNVALGELWNSLPDLGRYQLPDASAPKALMAFEASSYMDVHHYIGTQNTVMLQVLGFSGPMPESDSAAAAALAQLLQDSPTADAWTRPLEGTFTLGQLANDEWQANISWTIGSPAQPADPDLHQDFLNRVAPEYRFERERWLRPRLPGQSGTLSPLMTWWALLFGLSMLARYEPRRWTKHLAVDTSTSAVPLEGALGRAMEVIPHLVLEALLGQPHILYRWPG